MNILLLADDAGIGKQATDMIIDAWQHKKLDGFSILANKECYVQIADALQTHKELNCVLSAHLNLSDGPVFFRNGKKSLISTADGRLKISFVKALRLLLSGKQTRNTFLLEVENEWRAQLSFIKKLCGERKLYAVNSHNYIHMLPPLFKLAAKLADENSVPHIRFVSESFIIVHFRNLFSVSFYLNCIKLFVLSCCRLLIKAEAIYFKPVAEKTFGVLYSGRVTAESIRTAVNSKMNRNKELIEIVVHPGQSLLSEVENWTSSRRSIEFFIHNNRRKEWDVVKNKYHEFHYTTKNI